METSIPIINQGDLDRGLPTAITVDRLDDYMKRNSNLVFPHRHHFYQCVLFTKGNGYHIIDFQQFQITPWQIYFMTPAQIHTWAFDQNVQGYLVNFSIQSFQTILLRNKFPFFNGRIEDSVFTVDQSIRTSVLTTFQQMLENRIDVDFCKVSLLYLFHVLASKHTSSSPFSDTYSARLLANFLTLIESNYMSMKLPKDFAALLYITPNHLNALCKEHIGLSAGEVIRNRILLEAKRLLSIRKLNISQISDELNFSDNSYFSKFFKKLEGISPEEFRNKIWKKL